MVIFLGEWRPGHGEIIDFPVSIGYGNHVSMILPNYFGTFGVPVSGSRFGRLASGWGSERLGATPTAALIFSRESAVDTRAHV